MEMTGFTKRGGGFLAAGLLAVVGCAAHPPVVLVEDGRSRCVIVLPDDPHQWEQHAADELINHLKQISDAKVEVMKAGEVPPPGTVRILLGAPARELIDSELLDAAEGARRDELSCRDGFVIKTSKNAIAIRGLRPTGTLYGTYELLERLGCRWFFPGELGRSVPNHDTIKVEAMNVVQAPTFDMRSMWFSGDHAAAKYFTPWYRRNRLSLEYEYNAAHIQHPIPQLSNPGAAEALAKKLIEKGLAGRQGPVRLSLGWSDNFVSQVELVDENRGYGIRHPWHPIYYQASDVLIRYYNEAVERVEKVRPNNVYGFLVYNDYFLAPIAHKLHPRLSPMVAPIEQATRHAAYTGQCWRRDMLFDVLKTWCTLSDNVFIYDYEPGFINLSDSTPMPAVTRFRTEMPLMAQWGVRGILQQSILSIMNQGPNLYVRARQMWDAGVDVDELLDEYYTHLFGPAAAVVRQYWDAFERMMHHGPGHHRNVMKAMYPLDRVRRLERFVREAEAKAQTDMQRRRVQIIRYCQNNLMLYLRMRLAEDEGRFADAVALGEQILMLHEQIEAFDTVLFKIGDMDRHDENHPHHAGGWVRQNKTRLAMTDGTKGDLVAMLDDKWRFRIDRHNEGITWRWFETDHDTSRWGRLRTTRTWDVQGYEDQLDRYETVGWMRTRVKVPKRFAGRTIRMSFFHPQGAWGSMQVWVNGRFAGARRLDFFRWEEERRHGNVDVTDLIRLGESNQITMRIVKGTRWGGFDRRILLWSPAGQ